jgi:hypothetical protein
VRTMMRRHRGAAKSCPGQEIYPYLLHGLAVERANQVCCMVAR